MEIRSTVQTHTMLEKTQIHMSPGAFKAHDVSVNFVDQQPIRFDVRIPETPPRSFQRMVKVRGRQWFVLSLSSVCPQFVLN